MAIYCNGDSRKELAEWSNQSWDASGEIFDNISSNINIGVDLNYFELLNY